MSGYREMAVLLSFSSIQMGKEVVCVRAEV